MTTDELCDAVRAVFDELKPHDLITDSVTLPTSALGVTVHQIHVSYIKGNEFLPLDKLISRLSTFGKVMAEFRGAGGKETPRILFDVAPKDATRSN